jgi:hypothetical protein
MKRLYLFNTIVAVSILAMSGCKPPATSEDIKREFRKEKTILAIAKVPNRGFFVPGYVQLQRDLRSIDCTDCTDFGRMGARCVLLPALHNHKKTNQP